MDVHLVAGALGLGQAVLQHEARHADLVEPARDIVTLRGRSPGCGVRRRGRSPPRRRWPCRAAAGRPSASGCGPARRGGRAPRPSRSRRPPRDRSSPRSPGPGRPERDHLRLVGRQAPRRQHHPDEKGPRQPHGASPPSIAASILCHAVRQNHACHHGRCLPIDGPIAPSS